MRFQGRDGLMLWAIFTYGGVLARRHLKRLFFPTTTLRACLKRLAKLDNAGYVARPTKEQRRRFPIPEPVCYLDWKGILWVAAQLGAEVDPPKNPTSENQLRKLARGLRAQGIRWLREPRWIQLSHDLAVVDFRLAVERSIRDLPFFTLEAWQHEGEFRSDGDTIEYTIKGRGGKVKQEKKRVYPDSYFVIVDRQRLAQDLPARARLLLELDHATHPNSRFGREKIVPGLAYIKSPAYKARFGHNSGRWLVLTTGDRRMDNLMRQARKMAGKEAGTFWFTTFGDLEGVNVLTAPIWRQVGSETQSPLFTT